MITLQCSVARAADLPKNWTLLDMMHAAANASPPSRDATCALAHPAGPQPHTGEQHAAAAPLFAAPAATTAESQVRMPVHPPCNATSQRSVVTSCTRVTCALAPCDARPPTATHTPSCGLYPATAGTWASWSRANHTSPLALRLTTGTGAAHYRRERWRGGGGAGSARLVLPGALIDVVAGCRVTEWQVRRRGVLGFIKRNYISFAT